MSIANIHPHAYYFDIADYGLEAVVDTWEDMEGVFLRLSTRRPGEANWTFNVQNCVWRYSTKEECDVGITSVVEFINRYMAETFPKKGSTSPEFNGVQYIATVVREGLLFNPETNQLEVK